MASIIEKAKHIRLLICDVDGVLTDGRLFYTSDGMAYKAFHVQDGMGLKLLMLSGVEVAVITTCASPIVAKRMQQLEISHVFQGQVTKISAYETLLKQLQLSDEQVAYIGDDWPDEPLIKRAGLGIAVPNAIQAIRELASYTTQKSGGDGAVRELCDLIMHAQNSLSQALKQYHQSA